MVENQGWQNLSVVKTMRWSSMLTQETSQKGRESGIINEQRMQRQMWSLFLIRGKAESDKGPLIRIGAGTRCLSWRDTGWHVRHLGPRETEFKT